jgi:hypothetical protein
MSLTITLSALGRPNFTYPRAVAQECCSASPSRRLRRAPRAARRGASCTVRSVNEQAGGFGVGRATEVTGSRKRQARPSTNHFGNLLEEACPNHSYPIKQKLRDYGLMKSFMTSGSLS